jgi:hypothetical protein
MTEPLSSPRISRRSLLRGGAAAALAAGLPPAAYAARMPPAREAAAGPHDRRPVNIRVSRDGYAGHGEPSLAINPRNPRNLLGACMVWHGNQVEHEIIATYASFDGGRAWHSNGALPLPHNTMFADDVSVAFDPAGRGFVCATAVTGPGDRGVYLWRTDDGGVSFSGPIPVVTRVFVDHPWLAIAPDRGNMHAVWVDYQALGYTRSLDGGATFDAARAIPAADGTSINGPMVAAGRGGLVAAIYAIATDGPGGSDPGGAAASGDSKQGPGGDTNMQIGVVCSANAGQSFAAPLTLGTTAFDIALAGDVHPGSSPAIAAAPNHRALYAAFVTHEPGAGHSDVMVTASLDRGRSWSTPAAATPPDNRIYFQPQLAVDRSGRVALSAFALADGRIDTVLFRSPARRLSFGPPLTVTNRSFDPARGVQGGKHGAWWVGDYQGLAASTASAVHPLWNDTRTGALELFTAAVPQPEASPQQA